MSSDLREAWSLPIFRKALFRGSVRAVGASIATVIAYLTTGDAFILAVGSFLSGAWGFSEIHQTILRWMIEDVKASLRSDD